MQHLIVFLATLELLCKAGCVSPYVQYQTCHFFFSSNPRDKNLSAFKFVRVIAVAHCCSHMHFSGTHSPGFFVRRFRQYTYLQIKHPCTSTICRIPIARGRVNYRGDTIRSSRGDVVVRTRGMNDEFIW